MPMNGSLSSAVILTGLVLVMVVLAIMLIIVIMKGRAAHGASMNPSLASESAAAAQAFLASAVQSDIEEEIVAVIAAAASAYMAATEPGKSFAITGISRSQGSRPVWGFAGMQQNTRPF